MVRMRIKTKRGKAVAVIQECEQIIRSKKPNILWMPYQQGKYFKNLRRTRSREFSVTMVFKAAIVKFFNDYPKLKKSSLSLHFLKNNFKIVNLKS